jgi:hypothetical protein
MPAFAELEDAKISPVSDTSGPTSMKKKIRLAKQRQTEINDKFKTLEEVESINDSLISFEEKQEAIKRFIDDYPDRTQN